MGIDEDENVDGGFDDAAARKIGRNVWKQLKVSKSKVLMAVINCKRSHLPKNTLVTKLS